MSIHRFKGDLIVATTFPVLLLLHSAAFFLLPFLVPVATAILVGAVGVLVTVWSLWRLISLRSRQVLVPITVICATWLAWGLLPMRELGVIARFAVHKHSYDVAVAQTSGGAQPACLASRECASDGNTPPYLVFPFPGFLTGWIGVVHVPEENQAPSLERLKAFASDAGCDPDPVASRYYVCSFY